jgi:signal peptidase I
MEPIWNTLRAMHDYIHDDLEVGDSMYYIFGFFVIIGLVAQWRLYEKAGQPGWACLVPVYNMIVFLKIVGRPASHLFLFFIPIVGQLYFLPKVWIETAQSFGKRSMVDYVLVIALNGLYILNLGMSYDTKYIGPVYGKAVDPAHPIKPRPSLA